MADGKTSEVAAGENFNPAALVGREIETEWSWDERDVMLYALGVGAGREPWSELELTTENSDGPPLRAIPSFGVLMTQTVTEELLEGVDQAIIIHAEQEVRVTAPLPASGRARVIGRIDAAYDKGSNALLDTSAVAVDVASGEELLQARSVVYLRGAGGFGGGRGPSSDWSVPDRAPDRSLEAEVRPDQALLYRLSGDRNPLHADPVFARAAGFDGPILHGLATFGFTVRLLFAEYCDNDPARFAATAVRFSSPVIPGEALRVDCWSEGSVVLFQTSNESGTVVLDRGRFETRG